MKFKNQTSGSLENKLLEVSKSNGNDTDINYTEFNDTYPFPSSNDSRLGPDGKDEYTTYYKYFYERLDYQYLLQDYPLDKDILENILDLIVDTVCSKRKIIRIASDDKPIDIVKSKFMKLDSEHIRYVMDCFKKNTTKVHNIRQYLLAAIYNAPLTIGSYFDALVRHDMSEVF